MLNPYELAQQARERAVHNYLGECTRLTNEGDAIAPLDHDGAYALWCDAMKAFDAAAVVAGKLNLEDKSV